MTAWGELAKAHAADGGAGLAVLSESFSSPTLARLAAELRTRFPRLQWATYDAVSDENRLAGLRQATGRDVDLMLRLDQRLGDSRPRRRPAAHRPGDDPSRARLRGRQARRRLGRRDEPALRRRRGLLADGSDGGSSAPSREPADRPVPRGARRAPWSRRGGAASQTGAGVPGVDPRWIDALAKDLLANRGKGLIVAGERQPAAVHAAVCALNAHLGNTGKTVSYYETKDAALPSVSSLTSLVSAMKGGAVQTLVILGGNPVFDAPADLDFASAMAKVPHAIALGHAVDETSANAEWHIPLAHYLESWGDARAVGGTLSVVQPLILPLFGGRTPGRSAGADGRRRGSSRLRHRARHLETDPRRGEFDKKWNRVLHDGLLAGSELPEVVPAVTGALRGARAPDGARRDSRADAVLRAAWRSCSSRRPSLHDGRFANDGWLQELPDPLTKLTWDNPALVSPKTAETLGLANEDWSVSITRAARSSFRCGSSPAWPTAWWPSRLATAVRSAGRIGSGVGFDTFKVRTLHRRLASTAAPASPRLGRTYPLSVDPGPRQHGGTPARPRVDARPSFDRKCRRTSASRRSAPAKPRADSRRARRLRGGIASLLTLEGAHLRSGPPVGDDDRPERVHRVQRVHGRLPEREQRAGRRQDPGGEGGARCTGCASTGTSPASPPAARRSSSSRFPACSARMPRASRSAPWPRPFTTREGLNVMVYNRCIGTRYCSNNCPYKVRHFNFFNFTKDTPDILKLAMNPDVTVRARGVMEKCTYCVQRINRAKIDAKLAGRELRDGDVKTACQQACPAAAIEFGDIRDQSSRVAKAKADPRNYALLEELNTKPRTTYLAKVRNPNPDLKGVRTDATAWRRDKEARPIA